MSDPIRSLRFAEREYYDIWNDVEVVELQAITNIGTYTATVPMDIGSSKLRTRPRGLPSVRSERLCTPMSRPMKLALDNSVFVQSVEED
jgi:hypothetical protein